MTDEPGYPPEEIERGEAKPGGNLPLWGCFLFPALLLIFIYGLYRFAIWIGFSASVGL